MPYLLQINSHCVCILELKGFGQKSFKKFWSHSTSLPALSRVINLDFIVERAIHLYLEDFQETAPPPRVNTYPLVDFTSFDLVIQFASLYSSNTVEY